MTTAFKLTGMIIGISLMALSIAWSSNPESGAFVLFCGGALVFLGAMKGDVIWKNVNQK